MTAYSALQQEELAAEKDGYTATKHQREVPILSFPLFTPLSRSHHRLLPFPLPSLGCKELMEPQGEGQASGLGEQEVGLGENVASGQD